MTEFRQVERLLLQIQRDLVAQTNLRTLLAHADATVAGHRQDLRSLRARLRRGAMTRPTRLNRSPAPGRAR